MSELSGFRIQLRKKRNEIEASDSSEDEAPLIDTAKSQRKAMNERLKATNAKNLLKSQELESSSSAYLGYDSVYDIVQEERRDKNAWERQPKTDEKPKYMDKLLLAAKDRELHYEKSRENTIRREIDQENKELGVATEVFVTGAYKKKLEERNQWEKEQAEIARREAEDDVSNKPDLIGFYSGMLDTITGTPMAEISAKQLLPSIPKVVVEDKQKRSSMDLNKPLIDIKPSDTIDVTESATTADMIEQARIRALDRARKRKRN